MQETQCNSPDCGKVLRMDKYGRGEGILRGGGFFCDMDCYHDYQRHEINRVIAELQED